MDLTEILKRDERLQVSPRGGVIDPSGRETWRSAAVDRRALIELLREARKALNSVGECHGCIYNDHDEALALRERLEVLNHQPAFGTERR